MGEILALNEERPGILLNNLQSTGQSPPQRTIWSRGPIMLTLRNPVVLHVWLTTDAGKLGYTQRHLQWRATLI